MHEMCNFKEILEVSFEIPCKVYLALSPTEEGSFG